MTTAAVVDASMVYAASRLVSGVHEDPSWRFRDSYRKNDDRDLCLELLHYIALFDKLIIDNSSLNEEQGDLAQQAVSEIESVLNLDAPIEVRNVAPRGERLDYFSESRVQRKFISYFSGIISANPSLSSSISRINVPWAYHQNDHHDWDSVLNVATEFSVPASFVPFLIFVWRGVVYSAFAHNAVLKSGERVSYVAAPGRMLALQAVLSGADFKKYEWPRKAWRSLLDELPSLPEEGYSFSFLESLSELDVSPLSSIIESMNVADALRFVCDWRNCSKGISLRENFGDIVFSVSSTTLLGSVNIQIARNLSIGGDFNQTLIARPLSA